MCRPQGCPGKVAVSRSIIEAAQQMTARMLADEGHMLELESLAIDVNLACRRRRAWHALKGVPRRIYTIVPVVAFAAGSRAVRGIPASLDKWRARCRRHGAAGRIRPRFPQSHRSDRRRRALDTGLHFAFSSRSARSVLFSGMVGDTPWAGLNQAEADCRFFRSNMR